MHTGPSVFPCEHTGPVHKKAVATWDNIVIHCFHSPYDFDVLTYD